MAQTKTEDDRIQEAYDDRFKRLTDTPDMGALKDQGDAIIRDADEITGLPGYALGGAQGLGASSLGEYSQRISNSLRIIQQVLLNEDMFFIEPAMTSLFHHVVKENKELLRGADVQVVVRGHRGSSAGIGGEGGATGRR